MQAETVPKRIYGQLLPLRGSALLLPKAALLEVRIMEGISVATDGPAWLLGFYDWQTHSLPVVSLESMAGQPLPVRMPRSRLAVINSLGTSLDPGLFMLVTQGHPHLAGITPAALQVLPDEDAAAGIALSHVRLANTPAMIPDLERIERKIARALATVDRQGIASQPWQTTIS